MSQPRKRESWQFHGDAHLISWIWWLVHEDGVSASAKLHRIRCAIRNHGKKR